MNQRLRALCDLSMGSAREYVGRHEYDGRVEDLSPGGVRAALARLGGPAPVNREHGPHDEAQLAAFERLARLELGQLELHRANPLYHIAALDVSSYDREYAPAAERAEARRRHLAAWPDAVDAAVKALDRVPAPVAGSLLAAAKGLIADFAEGSGRRGPGNPEGVPRWIGRGPGNPEGVPRWIGRGPGNPEGVPRWIGRGPGNPEGVPRLDRADLRGGAPGNRAGGEGDPDPVVARALAAHGRLVAHLEAAAKEGPP